MQGKLFQRCTPLLYCSVLSLGGNVNTRRTPKPDMGSIFHIRNQWNILIIGNYYVNYQNYQSLMLLTSSETKRTLMHLFLFTNSAQREYTRPQLTFLALVYLEPTKSSKNTKNQVVITDSCFFKLFTFCEAHFYCRGLKYFIFENSNILASIWF